MTLLAPQARRSAAARGAAFVAREFRDALPAIAFFAAGFNLIELTTQLILDDYNVQFANFLLATTAALLVGKAVLVANVLPFLRRFDGSPLIQPILFKTIVYWAVVAVVHLIERIVEYLAGGGGLGSIPAYMTTHFSWHRFAATQIWVLVLFLMYTTASDLNALFGDGELYKVFFTRRSSDLKLSRRQRIRTLVRLSRLTEAHGVAELRDPGTPAHAVMVGLIGALAEPSSEPAARRMS